LSAIAEDVVDLGVLKAANLIPPQTERVKIIASGALDRPVTLKGLGVTKGARVAVESAGGRIEE
jgi:large subunit ribosomal protein L15